MRRTVPFGVAVVATTVMVLGVMVGVGIGQSVDRVGQPVTSHGGTPTDVYTSGEGGKCLEGATGTESRALLPTAVTVTGESNLVVMFTSRWANLGLPEQGAVRFDLLDAEGNVESSPQWYVGGTWTQLTTASPIWTFRNLAAGDYTVQVNVFVSRVDPHHEFIEGRGEAGVFSCALTAFVMPVAA